MKKILSVVLAFVLVLSLMPVSTTFAIASDHFFQLRFDNLSDLTAPEARNYTNAVTDKTISGEQYRGAVGKAYYVPKATKSWSRNIFYGYKDVVTGNIGDVYELSAWYKLTGPEEVSSAKVQFGADEAKGKDGVKFANSSGRTVSSVPKNEWVKLQSSYTVVESDPGVSPKIDNNQVRKVIKKAEQNTVLRRKIGILGVCITTL